MSEFFSNLYTFKGRLGRLAFIWKYIFIIALIAFFTLVMVFGTPLLASIAPIVGLIFMGLMYFFIICFSFIPPLAITTRRLHDIGLSGWWQILPSLMLVASMGIILFSLIQSGVSISVEHLKVMRGEKIGLLITQSFSGTYAALASFCFAILPLFGLVLLVLPGKKGLNKYDEFMLGSKGQGGHSYTAGSKYAGNKYLVNFTTPIPEESMYLIKHLKESSSDIVKITMPKDRQSAVVELSKRTTLNQKKLKKLFISIGFQVKSTFLEK